jgi:hypothetical protein
MPNAQLPMPNGQFLTSNTQLPTPNTEFPIELPDCQNTAAFGVWTPLVVGSLQWALGVGNWALGRWVLGRWALGVGS